MVKGVFLYVRDGSVDKGVISLTNIYLFMYLLWRNNIFEYIIDGNCSRGYLT